MSACAGRRKVLVTGANGLIGNLVFARLATQPDSYEPYAMLRHLRPSLHAQGARLVEIPEEQRRTADLADFPAVQQAVAGMDVVVHMAADPDGSSGWDSVLNSNIIGAYHVFEACRMAGVKRVVFASTNQVVFGYGADEPYASLLRGRFDELAGEPPPPPIRHDQPARPINLYGCSKVFGEALAYLYAFRSEMSCLCVRIGWVLADDRVGSRALWFSQSDCVQLIERCIAAPEGLRYDIFFGQSDNQYNLVDIQHTREVLGYAPQDRAEEHLHDKP
jgi:NAD+ dependent glucose-6-phosphate dehydrogenase